MVESKGLSTFPKFAYVAHIKNLPIVGKFFLFNVYSNFHDNMVLYTIQTIYFFNPILD